MANELQINANRLNAEKSTGPSTIEGKLKSSQNALRHGMLAQTIVLEGESSERFQLLLATLVDDFGPRTAAELALVETMAVARWRQMRLWAFCGRPILKQGYGKMFYPASTKCMQSQCL